MLPAMTFPYTEATPPETWRLATSALLRQHVVTSLTHAGQRDIPPSEVHRTVSYIIFQAVCLSRHDALTTAFLHSKRDRRRWRRCGALWGTRSAIYALRGVLDNARFHTIGVAQSTREEAKFALERQFYGDDAKAPQCTAALLKAGWLCN